MRIRQASVQDSASLARVQVDSYRSAYAGILPQAYLAHFSYEEQEQDWRELLSATNHDIVLAAQTDGGEIAGYALGRAEQTDVPGYDGELVALHVRRQHQRQGIGRQLIAAMATELERRGCRSLLLWTLEQNPSCAWCERLGGMCVARRSMELGDVDIAAFEVAYGWQCIQQVGDPNAGQAKERPA